MPLSINPFKQTGATGSFNVESTGLIAGLAQQDPAIRFQLSGGVVDAAETIPMYGSVAISEYVRGASGTPRRELGSIIKRATQIAGSPPAAGDLTGWCVFDQAHSMVISAESAVPQASAGGSVHFYRLGSGARLNLPIAPELAGLLPGLIYTTRVSWDFAYQRLCPLAGAGSAASVTGVTWSGGRATFTVGSDLTSRISAGSPVVVAGMTPSGYNGTWVVVSVNSATVVVTMPSNPGAFSAGGTLDEVTSSQTALPIRILDVNVGNSMVPVYDSVTGFVNWDRSNSAAVVQI